MHLLMLALSVVFVCEHGAAKSVVATAYFNKLAAERGLSVRATYRGVNPQAELSVSTLNGLKEDGFDLPAAKPSLISQQDVDNASVIFAIGCTLPSQAVASGKAGSWDDVPDDKGYGPMRDAIRRHVEQLVDEMAIRERFGPIAFFVGTWRGEQSGQPGTGTVERTYEAALNARFIREANTSTYPSEVHHHVSMFSVDQSRKRIVFRQFHQEGFVNTYLQEESGDPTRIVFVTESIENIPAGYRAREIYTIVSHDEFAERFEIAEPGRDFALYSEARLKRVR